MSVLHYWIGIIFLVALGHSQKNNPLVGQPITQAESENVLGSYEKKLLSAPMSQPGWTCWFRKAASNSCVYAIEVLSTEIEIFSQFFGQPTSTPNVIVVFAESNQTRKFEKKDPKTISNGILRIVVREGVKTGENKRKIAEEIYNELARRSFDDLLPTKSPKENGWLGTGLRTYFERVVLHKVNPLWFQESLMLVQDLQSRAFKNELNAYNQPLSERRCPLGKAESMVRMIWHVMGHENMKRGLKKFAAMRTQKNERTPRDFFNALVSSTDDTETKYFLDNFLESPWVKQRGYPIVHVSKSKSSPHTWNVFQTLPPLKFGNAPTEFRVIPLNYATQNRHNETSPSTWLRPNGLVRDVEVQSSHNDFIIFNNKQTGYYRVNYSDWASIADISFEDYNKTNRLNRAQLFDDSYQLVKLGAFNSVKWFLRLTLHLSKDGGTSPWIPAVRALLDLWTNMKNTEVSKPLASYISGLIKPFTERVDYNYGHLDNVLKTYIRPEMTELACQVGLETCRVATLKQLVDDVRGTKKIPVRLRGAVFREGMRTANATIWEEAYNLYKSEPKNHLHILRSLGHGSDPQLIKRLLGDLTDRTSLYPEDVDFRKAVLESIYEGHGTDEILDFVVDQMEIFKWNTRLWKWYSHCLAHMQITITTDDQQRKMDKFCRVSRNRSYLCHHDNWNKRSSPFKLPGSTEQDVREFLQSSEARLISSRP